MPSYPIWVNIDLADFVLKILSRAIIVLITLPIHEFAHGYAATKLGDPTPRYQGRMTLNPLAHIDYLGAACILILGFGWAKPVQVNANNFRNPKRDMAITAFAGPLSNIIVALISLVLYNVVYVLPITNLTFVTYLGGFFSYIADINIYLAVFNLIPIPPLDGSRLLSALLPTKQYYMLMRYERYFFFIILALLFFGKLDIPLFNASNFIENGLGYLAGLPFRFF